MNRILLRDEVKEGEHRTPITPTEAEALIKAGYIVDVETSETRIFPDEAFKNVGCGIVERHTWITEEENLPYDYVLGLKELPEPKQVLEDSIENKVITPHTMAQRHIFFAHCYKYQNDWKETLGRFMENEKAQILDIEFLVDDKGRRVAAFGHPAGYAGLAVGLITWVKQQQEINGDDKVNVNEPLSMFKSKEDLIEHVKALLNNVNRKPKVLVLGALGRCGTGACDFYEDVGLPTENIQKWDLAETKKGGPFPELLDVDILLNGIYVQKPIPPFLTKKMIHDAKERQLTVFVDVSCEMSERNPFPINNAITTFKEPSRRYIYNDDATKPLDVIAIDHLPSLIPKESSESFAALLLPTLLALKDTNLEPAELSQDIKLDGASDGSRVWLRAIKLFYEKCEELHRLEHVKRNRTHDDEEDVQQAKKKATA